MDNILTVREVADILKLEPLTVRQMFRQKRLRGFKMGKSWRTTETTLNEDIEAMARGEAPQPAKTKAPRKPAKAKPATLPPEEEAPSPPPPKPREKQAPEPESAEDAQQMLF